MEKNWPDGSRSRNISGGRGNKQKCMQACGSDQHFGETGVVQGGWVAGAQGVAETRPGTFVHGLTAETYSDHPGLGSKAWSYSVRPAKG